MKNLRRLMFRSAAVLLLPGKAGMVEIPAVQLKLFFGHLKPQSFHFGGQHFPGPLLGQGQGHDIAEEKRRRFLSNLSGGEQQRVAIARALSTGARLLLADEPTGNLDTANGNRVMDILRHLAHDENYCVVVVTHDLAIADAADQVYRMTDGILTAQSA